MAISNTIQIIKDTVTHTTIKLTGFFDGSGQENNLVKIQANTLYGALNTTGGQLSVSGNSLPYYDLQVNRCWYDVSGNGSAELVWSSDTPQPIFCMTSTGEYDGMGNWVTIPNNSRGQANSNGNIGIITYGMSANQGYTIVLELRKNNQMYQRGQFDDPASFNYGVYKTTP